MSEFVRYEDISKAISVDTLLEGDTLWLTSKQMSDLFGTSYRNIRNHLKNIFESGELDESDSVRTKDTIVREGPRDIQRTITLYSLDAVISVGYRVNSKQGVAFRKWATKVLAEHMAKGYTINHSNVSYAGIQEAMHTMQILADSLLPRDDLSEECRTLVELVSRYAETWTTLQEYDEGRFSIPHGSACRHETDGNKLLRDIEELKRTLLKKGEATEMFGSERSDAFRALVGNMDLTMFGSPLYKSAEEKAANLFYFIIKDHPFSDGNKRIASFCLLRFMQHQNLPVDISPKELAALALLVAKSDPNDKDLMIRLTMSNISKRNLANIKAENDRCSEKDLDCKPLMRY